MKKSLLALAVLGAFCGRCVGAVVGHAVRHPRRQRQVRQERRSLARSRARDRRHQQQPARLPWHRRPGRRPEGGLQPAVRHQPRHRHRRTRQVLESPRDREPVRRFGELRLGRDYMPTFWNRRSSMPSAPTASAARSTFASATTRCAQDNSIGYFLPTNLGGFYGQAMVAAGRRRHRSADRPVYSAASSASRAGPFDVASRTGTTPDVASLPVPRRRLATQHKKTDEHRRFVGLRLREAMGYYDEETLPTPRRRPARSAPSFPFGQSEVHVGYDRSKLRQQRRRSTRRSTNQGDVPVQPVQAHGHVRHGCAPEQQGRHRAVRCRAAQRPRPERRRQVEGLRVRHSSLLLIACSPQQAFRAD